MDNIDKGDEKCDISKYSTHCEQIYENLVKNSNIEYIKDETNKEQVISQLKQQIDLLYSRRYGKKRIG
jgi:hypothetical protein